MQMKTGGLGIPQPRAQFGEGGRGGLASWEPGPVVTGVFYILKGVSDGD